MKAPASPTIRHPRRVLLRSVLRRLGRIALRLLTRTSVHGRENLPAGGPLILVGNHVAVMEAALMTLLVPWEIEIIGTGDIPIDPRFAWIVRLWGYLPVNRGNTNREQMQLPLDVLQQQGVVGIFPEGGIWSPALKPPHSGVAWLSWRSGAPVLPVGFGGMQGALGAILALRRPRLTMNIGAALPAVTLQAPGRAHKQALTQAAAHIMRQVEALVPEEERRARQQLHDEHFDFSLGLGQDGAALRPVSVEHACGLGRFFHTPIILDVMERNMRLPVQPLLRIGEPQPAAKLHAALGAALSFLDTHPRFLSYRFGYAAAAEIHAGVRELHRLAQTAAQSGQLMQLRPLHRYRRGEAGEVQVLQPGRMHKL